jgi:hypothetical protein
VEEATGWYMYSSSDYSCFSSFGKKTGMHECSGETCFETVAFFPQIAAVHLACQWPWVYCFSLCSSLEPDVPCERTKEAVVGNPCKLAGGHCDVWLILQNAP